MGHHNVTSTLWVPQTIRHVLVIVLYLPCIFVVFVGNAFVIMAYRKDRRIREKTTNVYILNLAVADLLVGVVMAMYAPMYFTTEWVFGRWFCIVTWVLDYTATDMSAITIIAISVDRCLMVRNSLRHRSGQSNKKVAIICSILWLACLAVHSTLAFTYSAMTGYVHLKDTAYCNLGYGQNIFLLFMMFLVEILLPCICVFSLDLVVYFHLKRRAQNLLSKQGQEHITTVCRSSRASDVMRIHGNTSDSQHRRAARFLALLLFLFVICWLPYYILKCYELVQGSNDFIENACDVVAAILWINSAINPILYAFTNVLFKENFLHFVRCK